MPVQIAYREVKNRASCNLPFTDNMVLFGYLGYGYNWYSKNSLISWQYVVVTILRNSEQTGLSAILHYPNGYSHNLGQFSVSVLKNQLSKKYWYLWNDWVESNTELLNGWYFNQNCDNKQNLTT